jgi:hypothetical protein
MSKHHIYNRLSFLISSVFSCLYCLYWGMRARNRLLMSEGIQSLQRFISITSHFDDPARTGKVLLIPLVLDD